MDLDKARAIMADKHRAVLATRRGDGSVQMSPVTVALDAEGRPIISSRQTAYKVKNLRRDPDVEVRTAGARYSGRAREARDAEEDELARRLLVEKYESSPGHLENWRRSALPVVIVLTQ